MHVNITYYTETEGMNNLYCSFMFTKNKSSFNIANAVQPVNQNVRIVLFALVE